MKVGGCAADRLNLALWRAATGLFQRSNLKVLGRVFPQRRLVTRVSGRHRGSRRVGQVNAVACAGNFLEALRQFPSLGISDGPVGCQINVTGDRGNFSQRIRLFLCFWRKQRFAGLGADGQGKNSGSGDCE